MSDHQAAKSKGYVGADYLQQAAVLLADAKQRSYQQMHIQPGAHVLDMGCGPGIDTCALAAQADIQQVFGIDQDAGLLKQARQLAQQQNVAKRITLLQASAYQLPFHDNELDAVRSERVFQHLQNPGQALSELVRVTRSGGRIVVLDTDWYNVSVDTQLDDLEYKIIRAHAEQSCHNGYAGRQLYRLFKQQPLDNISVTPVPIVLDDYALCHAIFLEDAEHCALSSNSISTQELQQWQQAMTRATQEGIFFACIPSFMLSSTKI